MAALEAAIQKKTRYFSLRLDGRVKPGHDVERKFANVFAASSAAKNIGAIRF
jgi:hypothetical protein